ncbi:hypothetical protein PFY10_20140 [Chryseobacterium daecheongense]|nr:hypothetical protein PFY10_20140 [Chryseobacterium daecheongense]
MTEILNSRTPACQPSGIPTVKIVSVKDSLKESNFSGLQDEWHSARTD